MSLTNKMEMEAMTKLHRVIKITDLTEATYIVRFDRNGMKIRPGQHLVAGIRGNQDGREYSIFSGINDDFIEILVRKIEHGLVSRKLHDLKPGDYIEVNGPYGFFMTNAQPPGSKKFLFLASGTGIAPFHSFVRSYPDADYTLIHGITTIEEASLNEAFKNGRYISCTSRDEKGDFHGRLTGLLKQMKVEDDTMVYLCGNSAMIFEAIDILHGKGVSNSLIFTEVYF